MIPAAIFGRVNRIKIWRNCSTSKSKSVTRRSLRRRRACTRKREYALNHLLLNFMDKLFCFSNRLLHQRRKMNNYACMGWVIDRLIRPADWMFSNFRSCNVFVSTNRLHNHRSLRSCRFFLYFFLRRVFLPSLYIQSDIYNLFKLRTYPIEHET